MDNGKTEPKFKKLSPEQIVALPKDKRKAYELAERKYKFLKYFRQLPVYELAAGAAGRSADCFHLYEKVDSVFSAQIEQAKSDWALKHAKGVKSEDWLLERIMKNHFSPKVEVEQGISKELQDALDRQRKLLPKAQQ